MKTLFLCLIGSLITAQALAGVSVGSKKFTESVILAEIFSLAAKDLGQATEHRAELGGTRILWSALEVGEIAVYPEYTGTISEEIIRAPVPELARLRERLAPKGLGVSAAIGFNNTYAVGVKRELARKLGLEKISDLRRHPKLRAGWSNEFRSRQDGWPGLKQHYRLQLASDAGLDHDIAYRALAAGEIDLIDLYSTDAEIAFYDLVVLADDEKFFPAYDAVWVYRLDREAQLAPVLERLTGVIDERAMIEMNRLAKIEKKTPRSIAAQFLEARFKSAVVVQEQGLGGRLLQRTREHLTLVGVSLVFAILVAVPLGVLAAHSRVFGSLALTLVSAIQTIPALALLVMLIRPLNFLGLSGIGNTPALVALFFYSLLPILRSTKLGLDSIPRELRESAEVLNLTPRTILFKIELPMARGAILSGIKTALVLNVGFATLGALIGAGGYGQAILAGIRLDDFPMILEGAVPAAVLALVIQYGFYLAEEIHLDRNTR